jgi:hypothetical protein
MTAVVTLAIVASLRLGVDVSVGQQQLIQDLGPQVEKLADGVFVHKGRGFESNSGIIVTDEGVGSFDGRGAAAGRRAPLRVDARAAGNWDAAH